MYGTILSFVAFSVIEYAFMLKISPRDAFGVVVDNCIVFMYYIFGNLAIQCQNQLTDEQSDRVNKPYLPLPSNQVTRSELKIVSATSYSLYGFMTLFYFGVGTIHGLCGIVAIVLSSMYSLPPFNLKQIPFINSSVIIICRPLIYHTLLMVSFTEYLGKYYKQLRQENDIIQFDVINEINIRNDRYLACLNSFFWMQCWCVIAVCLYKDVPDIQGDASIDKITTLPMLIHKDLLFAMVLFTAFAAIYAARMEPIILSVAILLLFVPLFWKRHWIDQNYAKAYLQIWNFFYLNIASFVVYACLFV